MKIENLEQNVLTFQQLPVQVQEIYSRYHRESVNRGEQSVWWDSYWVAFSTDSNHTLKHERTGLEDGVVSVAFHGLDHRFYIDDKCFRFDGAAGQPYILHDNRLYYSLELNLQFEYLKIEDAKYVSVILPAIN